ncbi:SprT family zinc-dependent metalloprotease [Hymenobacter sp. ASUV-10]|uniref:SprT family zinc-dependent metalloprotease n=1 Tax=Hymenobacter aranciens TaxID=3063996 RepID=A0ABT9B723_9BACT|nr:SprT family zinc-dependent metalloprotease [Hymenobacter sp. ASUV-10]MDO7874079.1 SprT family zinc-dependent metalloprotease [Hymenobacter sp. ASUV-10]
MPRFLPAPQPAFVTFDNQRIDYTLAFRSRRTIGFAVRPDGTVRVTAPAGVPLSWVQQQVLKKADWILKHQEAFRQRAPLQPTRHYEAGALHYFLGEAYPLVFIETAKPGVRLAAGQLHIGSPAPLAPEAVAALLHQWYAREAVAHFAAAFARIWPRFAEFQLPPPALLVRSMRTRWGSCTPSTNRIRLSVDLIRASPDCIDYVLLHECCHLLVPDHSARFYVLQTRLMPDWERWKTELNGLPK